MRSGLATMLVATLLLSGCFGAAPTTPGASRDAEDVPVRPSAPTHDGKREDAPDRERPPSRPTCRERPVSFTHPPMRIEDFATLIPYGHLAGAHVTPIDHMYFSPADPRSPRDAYEVFAIGDAFIVDIAHRDRPVDGQGQGNVSEYRIVLEHACGLTSYLDLVTSLAPDLERAWRENATRRGGLAIPVAAGTVVGRIGGQTLDFGVYDERVVLPGFLTPSLYDREPWKVHTVDPFPHFENETRALLLAKLVRMAEPRAGRIDYDVEGRLVGNWFRVATNGYAGVDPARYWTGHLAIVYDHIDPTQIRFSIGDFAGEARQFGVKGNGPDPAGVEAGSGVLKLELVRYSHVDLDRPGEGWLMDRVAARPAAVNQERVEGVALVELVEPRLLKVEVFPGLDAGSVAGFTEAARMYER
ncbi:MAG TPA: hypothetical protein VM889_00020 [Candidatus Thermoplasmatota archaeon]|nr:hypothetical protein [Candidatus Thermoplasmatota archaeon]